MMDILSLFAAALVPQPASAQTACTPIPGIELLLERPRLRFVLFGEFHGTRELPELFADAVCAASATGRPLIVAIELPAHEQPAFDRYMASDGGSAARAALLASPGWQEEGGRTTAAIFQAIERMRLLAQRHPLRLIAFDTPLERGTSARREAAMAAALQHAAADDPNGLVIALTGSGHADRRGWTSHTPPFPSAAGLLPADRTVVLALARSGGRYWGCHSPTGDRSAGCTVYDMPSREPVAPRGIRLDPALREGFDGLFSAGQPYTASGPAIAASPDDVEE